VNLQTTRNDACGYVRSGRRGFSILLGTLVGAALLLLGACGGKSATPITIQVSPSTAQTLDEGEKVNFVATLGPSTMTQAANWTLTGTGCAGAGCGCLTTTSSNTCLQTINSVQTVTYTAPAGISTAVTASLEAVAVGNKSATVTVPISVVLPPVFTTITLPNGQNGVQYSQQIVVTGGVPPLVFSTTCPTCLPQGLTLNSSGIVTGTPSGSGSSNFTVTVNDNNNVAPTLSVSQAFSISVSPPLPLSITTHFVTDALNNAVYPGAQVGTLGGVQPLTWSVIAGTLPPGLTLGLHTGFISGTLPNLAGPFPQTFPFTVQAVDSALPAHQTATQALSITIVPPGPLEITTTSLPVGTTATAYNIGLGPSGGVPSYTWSIISGQLPSGLTLDPVAGVISGTPILTGTSTFTLQLEDSTSATTTQALSIKVNANAKSNLSLLSGSYSFLFRGFDKTKSSTGSVAIAGAIQADGNGTITAGEEDSNREGGVALGSTIAGTYTVGSDGRGTITWTVTNGFGATRDETYDFVLLSDDSARFFETDILGTQGSGILKRQSSSSIGAGSFGGNYAFGFSGQDLAGKPTAFAGTITADGSSSLSAGMADFNDAGAFDGGTGGLPLTLSGIFAVTGTFNRGTTNFIFQLPGQDQVTLLYVFYFVSPSDIFYVAIDTTDATHPRLSGEMIFQPTTTVFDRSALSGAAVATGSGVDTTNASVFAGLLQSDGIGGTTFTFDQNDAGTISLQQSLSDASYSVLPNGRVAFTGLGTRMSAAYLTGTNQGFIIGTDAAATLGQLEQQSGGPSFSAGSILDGYTLNAPVPVDNQVLSVLGQVVSDGASNITGIVDEAGQAGVTNPDQTLTSKYSVESNGRGSLTVTSSTTGLPPVLILYIVSPGNFRAISVTGSDQHPQVLFFDH
jgi:large repetitive protein